MNNSAMLRPNTDSVLTTHHCPPSSDPQGKRVGVEFGSTSYYALVSYFKEFNVRIVHDWVSFSCCREPRTVSPL